MGRKVVVYTEDDHADYRHGNCANHARQALRDNGVEQAYQEPSGNYHLICNSGYDGHYDVVCHERDGRLIEDTAFQPKDGVLVSIIKWLFGKRAHRVDPERLSRFS